MSTRLHDLGHQAAAHANTRHRHRHDTVIDVTVFCSCGLARRLVVIEPNLDGDDPYDSELVCRYLAALEKRHEDGSWPTPEPQPDHAPGSARDNSSEAA